MSIHFQIISRFLQIVLLKQKFIVLRAIKVGNLSIHYKINWFYNQFDGNSIIDLSEGDNLADKDNFFDDFFWVNYIAQGYIIGSASPARTRK